VVVLGLVVVVGLVVVGVVVVVGVGVVVGDAEWYTRDEVAHGAVGLPPALSISRRLIDDWLAEGRLDE
jgi:hypothetical protein